MATDGRGNNTYLFVYLVLSNYTLNANKRVIIEETDKQYLNTCMLKE